MHWSVILSVLTVALWIHGEAAGEKSRELCIFYYWQVGWETALKTCASEDTRLLCYKTKKEMDDITEAFRLTSINTAKLSLWLSNRNCSSTNETEKCLSLHIQKSGDTVWHYFLTNCDEAYQFVCCTDGGAETTTSVEFISSSTNHTSDTFDITDSSLVTTSHTASSIRAPFCKGVTRRGISWPDTDVGRFAVKPCPGNAVGEARWFCGHGRRKDGQLGRWKDSGPDLSQCRSVEIQNLKDRFNSSSASDIISDLEDIFKKEKEEEIFGNDLADIMLLMTALPDRLFSEMESLASAEKWTFTMDSVDKVASVMDNMVVMEDTWLDIDQECRCRVGTNLLSTMEGMGSLLADSMPHDMDRQSIFRDNMALQVLRPKPGESVSLPQCVVTSDYSHRGRVILPSGYDNQLDEDKGNVSLVFALYNNMSNILSSTQDRKDNRTSSLNSAVVSASVTQNRASVRIKNDVRILMEQASPNPEDADTVCVFWNMEEYRWDTTGCQLESSNGTHSVCVCNHLTNFALLMDYRDALGDLDQKAFHYITVIGCSLSIICLLICIVIFSYYSHFSRHSWGVRYVIHRNLCLTLLIANLVLVFGLDKTENQKVCALIAGLLHYFFLSAFSWMLLEGVHIYLLLVVVFASRKSHSEKYYIFGYGFPLIIVIITYFSRPKYYGTDTICWLSVEKGTIWGFMGPVASILILNTAALILAQYKASKISVKDDKIALIKRWLRVTFILFPVLGITWVFGFLYMGKLSEVAAYLFAIFNSFQGVCIFVFHCLLDKKARTMVLDSFRKKTMMSTITGSSGSRGTQKKTREPLQNGVKSNSVTPLDDDLNSPGREVTFQLPKKIKDKKDWSTWRKPWSFCFEMSVTDSSTKKEQSNNTPQAVVVKWNSLKEKSCA